MSEIAQVDPRAQGPDSGEHSEPDRRPGRINWVSSIPFFIAHAICLLAFVTGVTRTAAILFLATYWSRMFFITGGYHRYFAHRAYRLGRIPQFIFAFGGLTAAQKGPLWWAGNHRAHHRNADTELDIHSPRHGFLWSHLGWILSDSYKETGRSEMRDFDDYPEIRYLDGHDWIGPWALGVTCFLIGGWSGLIVGFFCSTVLLWHSTFLVNSMAHVFGRRTYATDDTSRNSLLIALATFGEGWHNNHHRYQSAARQGHRWWQIDVTFYVLWLLSRVGIVRGLRPVPARVIEEGRRHR